MAIDGAQKTGAPLIFEVAGEVETLGTPEFETAPAGEDLDEMDLEKVASDFGKVGFPKVKFVEAEVDEETPTEFLKFDEFSDAVDVEFEFDDVVSPVEAVAGECIDVPSPNALSLCRTEKFRR